MIKTFNTLGRNRK